MPHGRVSPKIDKTTLPHLRRIRKIFQISVFGASMRQLNSLRMLQTRGNNMAFTISFICQYYTISNHEIHGNTQKYAEGFLTV